MIAPDRFWLLTWTTYGTWLPGDPRGSVTTVRGDQTRVRHNQPGTPYDRAMAGLRTSAASLAAQPVYLTAEQATVALAQFQQSATYRGWFLLAAAVMRNHVHLVVGVLGDPEPDALLRDFKSYASRALNAKWGKPPAGTWWTQSGSKRKLSDPAAAVRYMLEQEYPLVLWAAEGEPTGERPA